MARGYTKAVERARHLVYVEDQYLWGDHVGNVFTEALRAHPDLHVIAVVPMHPDVEGFSRTAQLLGRRRAMLDMARIAPDRVAIYGIENHAGTPIYVHAKTCMVDDTWATIGSDNFNRRSWTHDSELSAVVVDTAGDYARDAAADPGRRAPRPRRLRGRDGRLRGAGRHVRGVRRVRRRPRRLARRRAGRSPPAGPAAPARAARARAGAPGRWPCRST